MTNTNTPAAPKIFQSLVDMQLEISTTGIAKSLSAVDKKGKELYKARSIDSVYNLLSPLFARFGIVVGLHCLSKEREAVQTQYSIQYQTFVTVEYTFTSSLDGSTHKVTVIGEAFDHSDKGIAKAMAMAFKYACFQVFCIPVCEDPDSIVHDKISNDEYQNSQKNTHYSSQPYQNGGQQHQNGQQQRQNSQQGTNNRQNRNNGQQDTNTQQNQSNNQQQSCITRDQANQLINVIRQAGQDPAKILVRYKISKFSELSVQDFNVVMTSVQRFIEEQHQINSQPQEFNNQYDNRQGNYSWYGNSRFEWQCSWDCLLPAGSIQRFFHSGRNQIYNEHIK